jgi:hypothetical protein
MSTTQSGKQLALTDNDSSCSINKPPTPLAKFSYRMHPGMSKTSKEWIFTKGLI